MNEGQPRAVLRLDTSVRANVIWRVQRDLRAYSIACMKSSRTDVESAARNGRIRMADLYGPGWGREAPFVDAGLIPVRMGGRDG